MVIGSKDRRFYSLDLLGAALLFLAAALAVASCSVQPGPSRGDEDLASFIRSNYDKEEVSIPMRDGAHLFTAIY
ncbi:MAG: hypothetical protein ABIF09_17390, partial [Gemmatimonadota bacterium]